MKAIWYHKHVAWDLVNNTRCYAAQKKIRDARAAMGPGNDEIYITLVHQPAESIHHVATSHADIEPVLQSLASGFRDEPDAFVQG